MMVVESVETSRLGRRDLREKCDLGGATILVGKDFFYKANEVVMIRSVRLT